MTEVHSKNFTISCRIFTLSLIEFQVTLKSIVFLMKIMNNNKYMRDKLCCSLNWFKMSMKKNIPLMYLKKLLSEKT
jgi:hypothetical protein